MYTCFREAVRAYARQSHPKLLFNSFFTLTLGRILRFWRATCIQLTPKLMTQCPATSVAVGLMCAYAKRSSRQRSRWHCTVQAPHSAIPQPNFVPVMPSTSRNTQRSGVSPSTSTLCVFPLPRPGTSSGLYILVAGRARDNYRKGPLKSRCRRDGFRRPHRDRDPRCSAFVWFCDEQMRGVGCLFPALSGYPSRL